MGEEIKKPVIGQIYVSTSEKVQPPSRYLVEYVSEPDEDDEEDDGEFWMVSVVNANNAADPLEIAYEHTKDEWAAFSKRLGLVLEQG